MEPTTALSNQEEQDQYASTQAYKVLENLLGKDLSAYIIILRSEEDGETSSTFGHKVSFKQTVHMTRCLMENLKNWDSLKAQSDRNE